MTRSLPLTELALIVFSQKPHVWNVLHRARSWQSTVTSHLLAEQTSKGGFGKLLAAEESQSKNRHVGGFQVPTAGALLPAGGDIPIRSGSYAWSSKRSPYPSWSVFIKTLFVSSLLQTWLQRLKPAHGIESVIPLNMTTSRRLLVTNSSSESRGENQAQDPKPQSSLSQDRKCWRCCSHPPLKHSSVWSQ